ncbi:FGGY carbohydrate kinase domain-containing protein isoform X2 [Cherax quadricarinatus]|uniref:FGGY carbohydrate kinase domain-containing protein isoform X2 n=1 Tax=Cherax quadricarinatus TaxID=27406 RepID=UPI00387E46BE
MDHRAKEQADFINSQEHYVLKYVGGTVLLEMQTPKLLWLKKNMKNTWARAGHFIDLPDFLTLKATGQFSRSLCSLVCKWTYMSYGRTQGWDSGFFKTIGLEDLADDDSHKIGKTVMTPGTNCGKISATAALELGLSDSTFVATSIIDAHAGGLALVAAGAKTKQDLIGRLGLICGTSTCHMCVSVDPIFVPGVWGPYYSAMIPGCWLAEGGQSSTGGLVDHIIKTHPAANDCPDENCLFPIKVVTQTKKKCFYHHSLAKVALILHLKTANVSTTPLRCCIISTSLELPNDSEGSYQLIVGLCSHKTIENDMINNIVKLKYPESNHCKLRCTCSVWYCDKRIAIYCRNTALVYVFEDTFHFITGIFFVCISKLKRRTMYLLFVVHVYSGTSTCEFNPFHDLARNWICSFAESVFLI